MPDTNWIPGLVVLGAGALAGAYLLMRTRSSAPSPARVDESGTDLERQRDALYTQIRELDGARASMGHADWRAERTRLVVEAARTLRALDGEVAPPPPPSAPRAPSWGERHPQLVGMAWGAGLVGFGAALWFGLQNDVKPKEEMAGGAMGGGSAMGGGGASAAQAEGAMRQRMQATLDAAKVAYEAAPTDVAAANRYSHLLLQAGEIMPAFEVTKKVTEQHPDDPEARTHQAIVLMEIGDMKMAAGLLDKVLTTTPGFAEALGYRGAIAYNEKDFPKAAELWEKARAADPSMAGMLDPLITAARNGGVGAPMGGGAAPAASGGGAPALADAAPTERDVTGTLALAPGAVAPPSGTVFVYARPSGVEAGPPAAAIREAVGAFPSTFRIGPNNSPMAGAFPEEMTLTARVDGDGNPTTKDPDDLEGRVEGVKPAQTGVVITLSRRGP